MKFYVITIMDNKYSVDAANRCIESAKEYGYTVEMHPAFSPKDNPKKYLKKRIFLLMNLKLMKGSPD